MIRILLTSAILIFNQSAFAGGDHAGNGGDICEMRFNSVRDDIVSWIKKGGSAGLQLPAEVPLEQYNSRMLEKISKAHVSCTAQTLTIDSAEKTCINFLDQNGSPKIICNLTRFLKTDQSDQYVLVHHEYAGLAGFESNKGEASIYPISKQIADYLEIEITKKLVVTPPVSGECRLNNADLEKELVAAIERNELSCIKVLASKLNLNKPMHTGKIIPGTNWGDNQAPLAYASRLGYADAIQILINAGAYIHYDAGKGDYPIAVASFMGQVEAIKVLVKNGAFVNYNACSVGNYYRACESPLGIALSRIGSIHRTKVFETAETLLKLGANPNLTTKEQTPLAYATADLGFVDLLVKYGANPNFRNEISGASAIFFCYTGACVDKLVQLGADVNQADFQGRTPLDMVFIDDVRSALTKHGAKSGNKS